MRPPSSRQSTGGEEDHDRLRRVLQDHSERGLGQGRGERYHTNQGRIHEEVAGSRLQAAGKRGPRSHIHRSQGGRLREEHTHLHVEGLPAAHNKHGQGLLAEGLPGAGGQQIQHSNRGHQPHQASGGREGHKHSQHKGVHQQLPGLPHKEGQDKESKGRELLPSKVKRHKGDERTPGRRARGRREVERRS